MIDVLFVVHAGGKVATGNGALDGLPLVGQTITVQGQDHRVLAVQATAHGSPNTLKRPEIDVEPLV